MKWIKGNWLTCIIGAVAVAALVLGAMGMTFPEPTITEEEAATLAENNNIAAENWTEMIKDFKAVSTLLDDVSETQLDEMTCTTSILRAIYDLNVGYMVDLDDIDQGCTP